jgi:hypothetical protein
MLGEPVIKVHTTIPTMNGEMDVLSEASGFLLTERPPLLRLPPAFEVWESLVDNLQPLILSGLIRKRVLQVRPTP